MDLHHDYLFKILLVGQPGVGKTSIVKSYVDGIFPEEHYSTIGVDFKIKTLILESGKSVKLQLWDTAGQERFKAVTSQYFRGAKGVVLVFGLNDAESFAKLPNWISLIQERASPLLFLVGNKDDLKEEREVSDEMICEFLKAHPNIHYQPVSAKTKQYIDVIFNKIADSLVKREVLKNEKEASKPVKIDLEPLEKRTGNSCCGTNG